MMPLVTPGTYAANITYNEYYMLIRLVVSSLFVFLFFVSIVFFLRRWFKEKREFVAIEELQEKIDDKLKNLMDLFIAIARQLDDVIEVMGDKPEQTMSEEWKYKHYYKDLIPLMHKLLIHEDWIYMHYSPGHISLWEKYCKILKGINR